MALEQAGSPTLTEETMVAASVLAAGSPIPTPAVPMVGPAVGTTRARRLGSARRDLLAKAVAVIAALGLWQASSAFLRPIFISTPYKVAVSLVDLIGNGQLPGAFLRSLWEMLAGLVIATAVAIVVGLLMGRIRLVERALDPVVAFGNATPSIALLPIMEVWFGLGSEARIAFIMVICTWPLLVNTYAGAKAVRGRYLDVGSAFGMSGWQQTWKIYLPGAMPFIFVGLRIALAVGAVGMILGGQEIGQSGLGGLTADFGSYSETANLVATIVTTTALAMFLFGLFRRIQNWQFPWIAATSAGRRQAK